MKDLNLNELLRYFSVGIFLIVILYLPTDKVTIKEQFATFDNGDIFGMSIFIGFTFGSILYISYRALIYPLIINPIINILFLKKYNEKFPNEKLNCFNVISFIDSERWKCTNDKIKSGLAEWASQVHFLYNISLTFIYVWILSLLNSNVKTIENWILFFAIFIVISIIHHARYKKFEIKMLSDK